MMSPGWYARRLSRMTPDEVLGRATAAARIRRWRGLLDEPATAEQRCWPERRFATGLADGVVERVCGAATARLMVTAERLLAGQGEFFGVPRHDLVTPDWSWDPKTGRRAPTDEYSFDIDYRNEQAVGDIKQLWELSRHQHLTVLAAAFAVSGDERYACRVADHLKSWWAANPPLRGVHWISGIELGIRLLSWVWVRRLLDSWPGAPGVFEDNAEALHHLYHHQRWLSALPSIGSSANNHAVAEAAGQLAAACAFPWFRESDRWREQALRLLDEQLQRNTFPSGLNRELATEYHGLVLELGLAAAAEAAAAGHPVPESTWLVLLRMTDALAAVLDTTLRPPRQGDADDGHGLVVDGAGTDRWASLLNTGAGLFGRLPWWPQTGWPASSDVRTTLLVALAGPQPATVVRPAHRPIHFADAGLTILRAPRRDSQGELWCRCDGGPHGFLSIAAHAHADALSVEIRHDGVDVLADPGTYCYHGQPQWRRYFRSTLGHNTLELSGQDQSSSGGPFLWVQHARSRVLVAHAHADGGARWCAEHDGYARRGRPTVHRRSVELDSANRTVTVVDEVTGPQWHPCRLAWHLGPRIHPDLAGNTAHLHWTGESPEHTARLELPAELSWTAHCGETNPPLGWYSAGFGRREPTYTLLGSGLVGGEAVGGKVTVLTTLLRFSS